MDKPVKQVREYYNYHECADYIAHKLGIRDLRDVDDHFHGNPEAEYKDFWHFLLDKLEIHYACEIWIGSDMKSTAEDWQKQIVDAFVSEFGEDAKYWVGW